jgi:RimJ/RimL family protein N-acetyltransferase
MTDQPVGEPVHEWRPPPAPERRAFTGRYCALEPLEVRHAEALWQAFALDREGHDWTYLLHGPYERFADFREWIIHASSTRDPLFFAVAGESGEPDGVAAFLRITPAAGSIEVGHIHFSPRLQRTRAATEAMYLMMAHAFASGYRRFEWKCDSLNAPSRAAAERLGFTFEGIFRQAMVYKGRNRDTAWYSIIDREWPSLSDAFEQWLSPENFDAQGRQRARLSDLASSARMARSRA